MNQEKIGKFIAELRKEKSMTQQELADKLMVTDRAVSNWENGRRLPDYSLLKDLSESLDISINELLAGQKLKDKDMLKKADENILKMSEYSNLKSMKYGIIGLIIAYMLLITISFCKGINTAPLTSLICAYNCVAFASRYKFNKNDGNLVPAIMFGIATILNTAAFILN